MQEPERILFVCTGNYYRSRFAEYLFNHLAEKCQKPLLAFSRGLEVFKSRNEGPISVYAKEYLEKKGIVFDAYRLPIQITEIDFLIAQKVIFMDDIEHRPMFRHYFPQMEDTFEYWNFRDIQFESPQIVLPALEQKVRSLFV